MQTEASQRHRSDEQRRFDDVSTARMVALFGGHEWLRWPADLLDALSPAPRWRPIAQKGAASDLSYFKHRFLEEKAAAKDAVGRKAREAHEELAVRYVELAARARKRQDVLLDQGLTETFPASDPVSVAHVS
jgi:hypothetical protein